MKKQDKTIIEKDFDILLNFIFSLLFNNKTWTLIFLWTGACILIAYRTGDIIINNTQPDFACFFILIPTVYILSKGEFNDKIRRD